MAKRPERNEASEYYFTYIDQVADGEICEQLVSQLQDVRAVANGITETQSLHRYATGKWSIRDVVNHVSDCERLFVARAFWFARGFESPLPSFDQEIAVSTARANDRRWADIVAEFEAIRCGTRHGRAAASPATTRLPYVRWHTCAWDPSLTTRRFCANVT